MKTTLVIKYTFNDDFDASQEERDAVVEQAFNALEGLCGCGRDGRVCSLEIGSAHWVTHGEDEHVEERVMKDTDE